jgi:hypothetical protein
MIDAETILNDMAVECCMESDGDVNRARQLLSDRLIATEPHANLERALCKKSRSREIEMLIYNTIAGLRSKGIFTTSSKRTLYGPIHHPLGDVWTSPTSTPSFVRTEKVHSTRLDALAKVARTCYLDTVIVQGRPVGDFTRDELDDFIIHVKNNVPKARFASLLIAGIAPGVPGKIRDFLTPDEADARYELAYSRPVDLN